MLIPLIASLATVALAPATTSVPKPTAPEPPVRVWLSEDGDFISGDRARVFAQAAEDGYLVVLHVDVDGRVRVLFPVDPADDQFVRGGKKYELKGRGDREAFVVEDTTGRGIIVAAFAKSRFAVEKFERNGHWDYRALSSDSVKVDPEAALLDLIREMQPTERFSYDLATYVVSSPRYARSRPRAYPGRYPWWWDDFYAPRVGVSLRLGSPFYRHRPYYYYDPFYTGRWGRWWF
ncbi:MAG: DUF4384 domain-containing protein [Gemmatimonadetes bacterium]|nr:DUF4384 domain-containing protein [Gemmatimonadota bacterium]